MLGTSQLKALKGYNQLKKNNYSRGEGMGNDNRFTWSGLPAWTEKKVARFRDH